MITHIGFTGTRYGTSEEQEQALITWLDQYQRQRRLSQVMVAHHGDCVVSDEKFHDMIRDMGRVYGDYMVHGHPPLDESLRALCER